jgi:hypothetical protein
MIRRHITSRRVRAGVGVLLLAGLIFQCQRALSSRSEPGSQIVISAPQKPSPTVAFASAVPQPQKIEPLEVAAARDPIAFFQQAVEHYDRSVRDYTCTFTKQELIAGELSAEQVMNAMYRDKPLSIRLEWVRNADKCARVLYVADKWVEKGEQMAVVEPGAIARLFVPYVMRAIHGPDAVKSSRRTIDQFGVRNSMCLVLKFALLAREKGVLEFKYVGNGKVNNRETLVFERRLPYEGENGLWPDRVLVVHMDKEMLVPTLCLSYADEQKEKLLGKYMCTDIKLNVNLADSVFTKEGMGLN